MLPNADDLDLAVRVFGVIGGVVVGYATDMVAFDLPDDVGDVGPSTVSIDGVDYALDVVVATGDPAPAERRIVALGEAKAGATLLLLFGTDGDPVLSASERQDVEPVDCPGCTKGT